MGVHPVAPARTWQPPLSQAGAGPSLLPFHFKRTAPRLGSDRAATAAQPCPGQEQPGEVRLREGVRVSSANGMQGRALSRDGEPWEEPRCPLKLVLVLVQQVAGDTLVLLPPFTPHPRPREVGARAAPLHTRFIDPFVQNCFSRFILQTHTRPRGGQGGQRGPHNQGAPGCCSPTPSHLRWGLGEVAVVG